MTEAKARLVSPEEIAELRILGYEVYSLPGVLLRVLDNSLEVQLLNQGIVSQPEDRYQTEDSFQYLKEGVRYIFKSVNGKLQIEADEESGR